MLVCFPVFILLLSFVFLLDMVLCFNLGRLVTWWCLMVVYFPVLIIIKI